MLQQLSQTSIILDDQHSGLAPCNPIFHSDPSLSNPDITARTSIHICNYTRESKRRQYSHWRKYLHLFELTYRFTIRNTLGQL